MITKNVIFLDQILESAFKIFNSFVFINNSLNNIGSVHAFSYKPALSFIGISVPPGKLFVSGLESDILLLFGGGELASDLNERLHERLVSASELLVFPGLALQLIFSNRDFSGEFN